MHKHTDWGKGTSTMRVMRRTDFLNYDDMKIGWGEEKEEKEGEEEKQG